MPHKWAMSNVQPGLKILFFYLGAHSCWQGRAKENKKINVKPTNLKKRLWFSGQTTILEVEIAAISSSSPTDWMDDARQVISWPGPRFPYLEKGALL